MKKETRLIMKHRLEKCIQWYRAYSAIVVMIPVVIVGVLAMVVYYIDIGVLTDEYERIHLIFFISCGIILLAGGLFGFVFLVLKMIFDSLGEGKMSNEHLALKADIVQTQNNITLAQNCIAGKIDTLDRIINNEIIRKENLSPDQSRIDTAVDIIKGGWDSAIRENQELRQQVMQLQQENTKLKCEIDRLSADNSESDEWEQ